MDLYFIELQNKEKEITLDIDRLTRLGLSDAVYKREFDIYIRKLQIVKDKMEEYGIKKRSKQIIHN